MLCYGISIHSLMRQGRRDHTSVKWTGSRPAIMNADMVGQTTICRLAGILPGDRAVLEQRGPNLWESGSRGIRTPDSRIKSPVLYLAEP